MLTVENEKMNDNKTLWHVLILVNMHVA